MARIESAVVRAMGSMETKLTVLGREEIAPSYLRLELDDGGLLARRPTHPTMWLRLWFADGGRGHQRAFTLVDPDASAGRFSLEFALHEGAASDWARQCRPGDTIRVSLLGSKPPWDARGRRGRRTAILSDAPFSGRTLVIGDSAALPAINSLLESLGEAPAEVWLEHRLPEDRQLLLHEGPNVSGHRVHRGDDSTGVRAVLESRGAPR
ncbi:siderophore-interacting protein, partial [Kocuria sp. p3-SID1428]|uniref:siderophore-interacting protein n=1 Tax=Kocuria sp. p3-SID1428 TaxID=2916182 RepID=UPI0021A74F77